MKIHIISTINGRLDEGMRNIATHLADEFAKEHRVYRSGLKELVSIVRNSCLCDCTMIFARGNRLVYWLAWVIGWLNKNLWIVCVQQPEEAFLKLTQMHPLRANYLCLTQENMKSVKLRKGSTVESFSPGIDTERFCPVSRERQRELKEQYGFFPEKTLVLHVGHCSEGRGLTDFACITEVQKMVVASGMFSHEETIHALHQDGVYVHQGYFPHIEQIYQMADVYLFPTRSTEHVISLPLSVMEALACGVPVVGYQDMKQLTQIPGENGSMLLVEDCSQLDAAVKQLSGSKAEHCLLTETQTWKQAARNVLSKIRGV